jgi:SOS-response transcriptional repressor LexA
MGFGEKLQITSFVVGVVGSLLVLASAVLGFIGTRISDKGYWEAIGVIKSEIKDARVRKEPQWTAFVKVKSNGFPAMDKPMKVRLQLHLHSDDNTIPLMVRVAADKDGHYSNTVAGPAGVVEQLIKEPQTYYVSVSHPSINWRAEVLGFDFPR